MNSFSGSLMQEQKLYMFNTIYGPTKNLIKNSYERQRTCSYKHEILRERERESIQWVKAVKQLDGGQF